MLRKAQDASNERRQRIASLTVAVVFIATPHSGAHLAKSVNATLRIAASKSLRELEYSADALVDLSQWFSPWAVKNNLKVEAYYEVEKYGGVLIVDQVTANPNVLGCDPVAIHADHVAIAKLHGRDAQLYESVRGFLLSLPHDYRPQGNSPAQGAISSGSGPHKGREPMDHQSARDGEAKAGQGHVAGEQPQQAPAKALRRGRFEAFGYDRNYGSALEYEVYQDGLPMNLSEVLDRWESVVEFVDFYIELFRQSGFYAFIWETPPVSSEWLDGAFRFIVHNLPRSSGRADRKTYAEYFDIEGAPEGVVSFLNLGRDSLLVVPSPFRLDADYSGMAEFLASAPVNQQRMLWSELGRLAKRRISNKPMWISVAGGGVPWLHIRLDSVAKYYRYGPYASPGYWAVTRMAQ